MATVTLDRPWLGLAAGLTTQFPVLLADASRQYSDAITGGVRGYANGRQRAITTADHPRGVTLTVAVTPAQYTTLAGWAGQTVLYRDGLGVKLWGVFFAVPWKPLLGYPGANGWRSVSLDLRELTYSEAV